MAEGAHKITQEFEAALCAYTGAPYCVCVDNASNAIFLTLMYQDVRGKEITIPNRTYPSVPCEIIHAGGIVKWYGSCLDGTLRGAYPLIGTRTWDCALRFTHAMYDYNTFMCLSFTGPFKHLKLSKGGAILTDDYAAYLWFKRARFSGRRECSYHDDHFDMLGWNMYMLPEIAARGLLMMAQFYDRFGRPIENEDIEMVYPDLSKFEIYQQQAK
jgi:dTDP-4-amino-4,6-dideoxygalactose transaminase